MTENYMTNMSAVAKKLGGLYLEDYDLMCSSDMPIDDYIQSAPMTARFRLSRIVEEAKKVRSSAHEADC